MLSSGLGAPYIAPEGASFRGFAPDPTEDFIMPDPQFFSLRT